MSKTPTETFYERYIFHIWLVTGYIGTLVVGMAFGLSFETEKDYLFLLALLIGSPALAVFWYTIYVFTGFIVSLVGVAVTERDPGALFAAFWLTISLLSFVLGAFFNAAE